jgi:hypothetical protein
MPAVWIWWLGAWRECHPHNPQYPWLPTSPASFWCYEDPTGVYDIDEDNDYASYWNYLDTETRHTTRFRPPNRNAN